MEQDPLANTNDSEQEDSYTPEEIRMFMQQCQSLGFQDTWTEEEATVFFNNLGRMLAEAEGKSIAEAVDRQLRSNPGV